MPTVNNTVRLAVAAAIAGAAANSASALDISLYNSATAVNVYLSGSTAVDNTLLNAAIEIAGPGGLCTSGSLDVYYIGTNSSYSNRLMFCTGSASSGVSGKPLVIYKESAVGSVNGVQPLINASQNVASTVNFIDPTLITDTNCATVQFNAAHGDFAAYTDHSGCPGADVIVNGIPSAGFADVEAAILRTPSGGNVTGPVGNLTSSPTLDQIWAVALTKNAYYALQAAEGFTSPSDLPANAPSLSRSELAGLMGGQILGWSELGLAPSDDNVYICRRDKGSGSEASFEYLFLGERCSLSDLVVPDENASTVWANGSAGNVRTCLQHMYTGGAQTGYYLTSVTVTQAGGQYAIGFQNAEVKSSDLTKVGDSIRFIAIDGAGPTVANVQNGFYPYFSSGLAYTITKGTNILNASSNTGKAVTALLGKLGHPVWTADSNSNYTGVLPWSPTLSVGDASPAGVYGPQGLYPPVPATSASAATNPVNPYTKSISGSVNNCDIPVWDANDYAGVTTTPVQTKLLGSGIVNN